MLINRTHLQGIASGAITLAFRRWLAPAVKTGGTQRTSIGVITIDAVDVVQEDEITDVMATAAGYPSRETLMAELERREGQTYRIRLRLSGPDPRITLREQSALQDDEFERVLAALERLDRRSTIGPWVAGTLEAIAARPGRRAADLAATLNQEKDAFKLNVRKLKNLGLTESLETGYRLSPRGAVVLNRLRESSSC